MTLQRTKTPRSCEEPENVGGWGLVPCATLTSSDGERRKSNRVKSTKGALKRVTFHPRHRQPSGVALPVRALRTADARWWERTTSRVHQTVDRKELPHAVETIALQRDEHKKKIQLSGHRRNQRRPQHRHAMPTGKPAKTKAVTLCEAQGSQGTSEIQTIENLGKRKDTKVPLEPTCGMWCVE